ncbi:MAG: Hpt domain-containing protein [Georgenia sp.]
MSGQIVIDRTAQRALDEQAGPQGAREFVARYLATLDDRLYLLRAALAAQDTARALVSLRGLQSTSAMVGAADLAELARQAEPSLRHGNFKPVRDLLPEMVELASRTATALRSTAHLAGVSR